MDHVDAQLQLEFLEDVPLPTKYFSKTCDQIFKAIMK